MSIVRDPNVKREDGNPHCFGNYLDSHYVCDNKCTKFMGCKVETAEEDSRREGKQFRDGSGRPTCFGKLYTPFSDECNSFCNAALECAEITEVNENRRRMVGGSSSGVRSEGLKVLNHTYQYQPSPTNKQQTPTMFSQPTVYQYQIDERTNAYMKQKYGLPLKIDPTVPGQFEGEPWYERFIKEVVKYAGMYALQLLALAISNTRWAPDVRKDGPV